MNVNNVSQSQQENESIIRRNRKQAYKILLNYCRGRSLSLEYILASKQPSINIPSEVKTYEALRKNIQCLYDDIILVQSIKNCLNLINCSLSCTEIMRLNDINFRSDNINKIEGIIFFSKAVMRLHNECYSELDLIEKMKNYSSVLSEYMKNVDRMKENEKNGEDQDSIKMEKAELLVYKINLMRTMKSVLIGYVSLNCPSLLKKIQAFKTSFRRNLTIDDFCDTWDIGLAP